LRAVGLLALTLAACRFDIDRLSAGGDGAGPADGVTGGDAVQLVDGSILVDGLGICSPATNDRMITPLDVSAGGTFCNVLEPANDDHDPICAAMGGRDLYYQIDLPAPETVYLDTFGSSGPTSLTVRTGACDLAGPELTCNVSDCSQGVQRVATLMAGSHCLIVDEVAPGAFDDHVALRVVRLGDVAIEMRSGVMNNGTTCGAGSDHASSYCGVSAGEDRAYHIAFCPGLIFTLALQMDSCTFPGRAVLSVRDPVTATELGCENQPCASAPFATPASLAGPGPFVVVVDSESGCGDFSVTGSLVE
jgi:hypothetical protein